MNSLSLLSLGRCVDAWAKCSPCPSSTPYRCQNDWSCRVNNATCPVSSTPQGVLVKTSFSGMTGVLLDESSNSHGERERVAKYYLGMPYDFWLKKATYQAKV